MRALVRHPLIDEILDARRDFARGQTAAFEGYRNHAHRVYNFARSIASWPPDAQDKAAIAAAFHDLCAFDGLDYIEPSIEEAGRYLRETGREAWDREVAYTIAFHHPGPSLSRRARKPRGTVPPSGLERLHHGIGEGRRRPAAYGSRLMAQRLSTTLRG